MNLGKLSTKPDLCSDIGIYRGRLINMLEMYLAGYTEHSSETSSSSWHAAVGYSVDPASSSPDGPNLEVSRDARISRLYPRLFNLVEIP